MNSSALNHFLISLACLFVSLSSLPLVHAQISESNLEILKNSEDTLGVLSYAVVHDTSATMRFAACRRMIPVLVQALKCKHSFDYPFERMRKVSIQYAPDSSFRIFSWQLYVDKDEYRYFGAIQINEAELKLYPLSDRSHMVSNVEQQQLTPAQWYGCLYYNIKSFETKGKKQYLLFGYDAYTFFEKRKLVDVLSFNDQAQPVFGSPVFKQLSADSSSHTIRNRIFIQYGSQASVRLNYDEGQEMITYDHLIVQMLDQRQGPVGIPDGSYVGYQFADGYWHYNPKLYHQAQDQPLMDASREENAERNKKKDIFGRKAKR